MSFCKEKVKKMMSFRKICSLFIVNRELACQSQMFKREQGFLLLLFCFFKSFYHSTELFSTNQILLGQLKFHAPLCPYEFQKWTRRVCDDEPKILFQKHLTKQDGIFAFSFSFEWKLDCKCRFMIKRTINSGLVWWLQSLVSTINLL